MRPRGPSNNYSNFSKTPKRSSCSSGAQLFVCIKVGLPFVCSRQNVRLLIKISLCRFQVGHGKQVCQFFVLPNFFFHIGMLILSQLIVGMAVENLKSIPRFQMISRSRMISYSSEFCLGVLTTLKLMRSKFNQLVAKVDGCIGAK